MKSVPGDILHIDKRNTYVSNNIVPKHIKPKLRLLNLQLSLEILTYISQKIIKQSKQLKNKQIFRFS